MLRRNLIQSLAGISPQLIAYTRIRIRANVAATNVVYCVRVRRAIEAIGAIRGRRRDLGVGTVGTVVAPPNAVLSISSRTQQRGQRNRCKQCFHEKLLHAVRLSAEGGELTS